MSLNQDKTQFGTPISLRRFFDNRRGRFGYMRGGPCSPIDKPTPTVAPPPPPPGGGGGT